MENKVWIVTKQRETSGEQWHVIAGVYDNFSDALARVNELFIEAEEVFEDLYEGTEYEAENHNNGYAELHYGSEDFDDIIIKATEYTINQATYDAIEK